MGISFQVSHHLLGGCGTASKYCRFDSSPTEQGCLSIDPFLCFSSIPLVATMGAATSKVVWWMATLKRDPHALLDLFKILPGHNTRFHVLFNQLGNIKNRFIVREHFHPVCQHDRAERTG